MLIESREQGKRGDGHILGVVYVVYRRVGSKLLHCMCLGAYK